MFTLSHALDFSPNLLLSIGFYDTCILFITMKVWANILLAKDIGLGCCHMGRFCFSQIYGDDHPLLICFGNALLKTQKFTFSFVSRFFNIASSCCFFNPVNINTVVKLCLSLSSIRIKSKYCVWSLVVYSYFIQVSYHPAFNELNKPPLHVVDILKILIQ